MAIQTIRDSKGKIIYIFVDYSMGSGTEEGMMY